MTDYFIQIGDYTQGKLTKAAKQAFEMEMSSNEELRRAVENHDIMDKALDFMWEEDARKVAMEAHETVVENSADSDTNQKKETKTISLSKRLTAIAASFAILLVAGFLMMQNLINKPAKLYAEFYVPYMGSQPRGDNSASSLALCEQGHSLMENEQIEKAIETFKTSIQNNEACVQKSQWYLSLCYLNQNNIEQRDSLINVILSTANHDYLSQAKDLFKNF